MTTFETLTLFAAFGAICAYYVTVVGFGLTAVAVVLALGLLGAVGGHQFGLGLLAGAFVTMQVGYVGGIMILALARHVRRLSTKDTRRIEGEPHINQE